MLLNESLYNEIDIIIKRKMTCKVSCITSYLDSHVTITSTKTVTSFACRSLSLFHRFTSWKLPLQVRTEARHCSYCGEPDHDVRTCPQLQPRLARVRRTRRRAEDRKVRRNFFLFFFPSSLFCSAPIVPSSDVDDESWLHLREGSWIFLHPYVRVVLLLASFSYLKMHVGCRTNPENWTDCVASSS